MSNATNCGRWIAPLFFVLISLCTPLVLRADGAADPNLPTTTAPTATAPADDAAVLKQIAAAIDKLHSPSNAAREEASVYLWRAGQKAVPALQRAAGSSDVEAATRAKEILEQFAWGIAPETPDEVRALARKIRAATTNERQRYVGELIQMGPKALPVLMTLASQGEFSAQIYWQLQSELGTRLYSTIPQMLNEGDVEKARQEFDLGLAMQDENTCVSFAAWCLTRHTLDEEIQKFAPMADRAPLVLARLYQAKGETDKARALARKHLPLEALRMALDAGDYNEALTLLERNADAWRRKYDVNGLKAACYRLLGNKAAFDKAMDRHASTDENGPTFTDATAFLVNEAFEPMIKRLTEQNHQVIAASLLIEQCRYDQALRLVEKPKKARPTDPDNPYGPEQSAAARAKLAFLQGRIDEGMKLAKELEDKPANPGQYLSLAADIYKEASQLTQARRCARQLLKISIDREPLILSPTSVTFNYNFSILFPSRQAEALALARMLKGAFPKDSLDALIEKIDLIFSPKPDATKLQAIVDKIPADTFNQLLEDLQADDILDDNVNYCPSVGSAQLLLAQACRSAGLAKASENYIKGVVKGIAYLQAWPPFEGQLWKEIAYIYANAELWPQAYENYLKAAKCSPQSGLNVFLAGMSAQRSGKADEGKKLMDKGLLMLLVSTRADMKDFVLLTYRYDLPQYRRQAMETILRIGGLEHLEHAGGWDWYIQTLEESGQYAKAAAAWERIRLSYLSSMTYTNLEQLLRAGQQLHKEQALAAMARKDFDAAMVQAQASMSAWRNRMDEALPDLLAGLEKAGRKDLADTLYTQTKGYLDDLIKKNPKSARLMNNQAWLMVSCRRDLPQALALAQECAKIATSYDILDTLAQAQFQMGDRTAALASEKKAMGLENGNDPLYAEYLGQQLKRIEKGDPKAPQVRLQANPPARNFYNGPDFGPQMYRD